ncbi:MAG: YhcH/YjgK/YiaL family protein [Bacteroidetes bacterium]|nr:YhcH/YjgK/YiaL family protein [Bacteroidota bacterium]
MIIDSIENAALYYGINGKIEKALKFLKETDFSKITTDRVEIEGEEIFALISKYKTIKPEDGKWEAHRQYVDIQFIISGGEDFGYVNVEYLDPTTDYDPENDIQWFNGDGDFFQLHEDEFVILFPQDAHMPKLAIEGSEEVKKVVIKVAV